MKNRSFFVAGALLLASLFTTSCKELVSNFDQPVKSYLTVAVADLTIPTGDTDTIKASSINSDKPITYKSSDESVAIVDENGVVTGVADGEAVITVSVEASENYLAGEQEVKVAVKRPLTFEAMEDGLICVNLNNYINLPEPIVYTVINEDGKETKTINVDGTGSQYRYEYINVKKGDKVEFESANDHTAVYEYDANYGYYSYRYVRIYPANCKCAVYGNVMSMINSDGNYHTNKTVTQPYAFYALLYGSYSSFDKDGDGIYETREYRTLSHDKYKLLLPATKLSDYCYYYMLGYTGITEIPELPADELTPYCYYYMFTNCWNLTKIASLPAKKLANYCYYGMFNNCDGLTESPALNAQEVDEYSYARMFQNCDKLKKAGEISATKVGFAGCYEMFYNCDALEKSPALPATELDSYSYYYMFRNCDNLKSAGEISATKLAYASCAQMFNSCLNLESGPSKLPAMELTSSCYQNMFANCQKLAKAPELPATKMADYCYGGMFYNTALKTAPALNATDLAPYCYEWMFENCTKLENAPALPATELKEGCYNSMFFGCTSLQKAPDLKAETLVDYCYQQMFRECTKLNYVKCLAKNCTNYSVTWMLYHAGTDESVTTRTLERDPDTYWFVLPAENYYSNALYVHEGWTITPPIAALSAPAAAPAQVAKAAPVLKQPVKHEIEKPALPEMPAELDE